MQGMKNIFLTSHFFKLTRKLPFCFSTSKFTNFTVDEHRGVHITTSELPKSQNQFLEMLSNSLIEWQSQKISGVWLQLPKNKLFLLETALGLEFQLHHCNTDYIMLTKWLKTDVESKIPFYSTHYVGCGGIVYNDKNEILLVRENVPTRKGWGIPGGQANRNELIEEACKRETFEETGVKTEFVELLGVRELSNFRFNTSEIYFLSLLKAEGSQLNIDKNEILEAKWAGKEEIREVIEKKNSWCPTILDSIRIGYKKVFEGEKQEKLFETFSKVQQGEKMYLYRTAKNYGL